MTKEELERDRREAKIVAIVVGAIILLVTMTLTVLHAQGTINLWK